MTQPRKEQLNILRAYWTVYVYTATSGTTSTVLPGGFVSATITQTSGGDLTSSAPVRGIVTTGIGGFVRLRKVTNALTLDDTGAQIFGRLTFSAGNYTVTYKRISGGVEVSATLPASGSYSVQMLFPEVMNFGEIPANADIIYGSSQELDTSGSTFIDLTVTGNTILGDSGTDTLTINAGLNGSLFPILSNGSNLGSDTLRFRTMSSTQFIARSDNTDTVKSNFNADKITYFNTSFAVDGLNDLNLGQVSATAINIGHFGATTTIGGTLVATGDASITGALTVNGSLSVFNGDVNITGTLTVGSLTFIDLVVNGNTTLGDTSADDIVFNGRINSNIIPKTSNLYTIGTSALRFAEVDATQFLARADNVNSSYAALDSDSLLSSGSFDIDGYGTLFIGVTHIGGIHIGRTGITTTADGYFTINPGALLKTSGTGNINLPNNSSARFRIEGIPVGPTVTAVNLDTLTDGSDADSLHTHSVVSAIAIVGITGEAIAIGELVAWDGYAGAPRIFKALAIDGYGELNNVVGVADGYSLGSGSTLTVLVTGEVNIPDGQWDVVPTVTDVGKLAYLSEIAGNWTLTGPTNPGSFAQKCGIVTRGGPGTSNIVIQIGDSFLN